MSDEAGTRNVPESAEAAAMDAQGAAVIMQHARERAGNELRVRRPAGASWAGPVGVLAVCALAGGGGVLLMAVIEPRLHRA